MKIASDLDNKDFVGAINPDSRLAVQFYLRSVQNEFESNKQGRPIFEDVDFVKIFVPGDSTSVIDTAVRDDHKQRFPLQWAHYKNKQGDTKEVGTPLSAWQRLTPAQAEELRAIKFFTVEAIANASDANLQRLGMIAGMSAYAFREAAQRFLATANNESAVQEAEARVKAAEERAANAEAAAATAQADMQRQLSEMQASIAALTEARAKPRKRRSEASTE